VGIVRHALSLNRGQGYQLRMSVRQSGRNSLQTGGSLSHFHLARILCQTQNTSNTSTYSTVLRDVAFFKAEEGVGVDI